MEPVIATNSSAGVETDAHGRAALLLVESLIHGLVATLVLSPADAVAIVENALEVGGVLALEPHDGAAFEKTSKDLLDAIFSSLERDCPT